MVLEVVAVPGFVECDGSVEIALEGLNVAEDGLGSAGNVDIFVKVRSPHFLREA